MDEDSEEPMDPQPTTDPIVPPNKFWRRAAQVKVEARWEQVQDAGGVSSGAPPRNNTGVEHDLPPSYEEAIKTFEQLINRHSSSTLLKNVHGTKEMQEELKIRKIHPVFYLKVEARDNFKKPFSTLVQRD